MQQFLWFICRSVDVDLISPSIRYKGNHVWRHRNKFIQIASVCFWPYDSVTVTAEEHGFDNPLYKIGPAHVGIWLNVYLAGKLVLHTHVSVFCVFHQMDGHTANQFGNGIHRRTYLRIV